jgi:hypothetical protein
VETFVWIVVAVASVVVLLGATEVALRAVRSKLRPLTDWDNWEVHHKVAAIDDLAVSAGASVVVVGSSTMNAGVDPDMLSRELKWSRPAFNAAVNGAGIRLLELWTMKIIVPRLRPDVVVIGLGTGELNGNNLIAKRLLNTMERSPAWRALVAGSQGHRLLDRIRSKLLLIRYRRFLGRRSMFQADPFQRGTACRRLGLLRFFLVFRYREYQIEDKQLEIWREALNDYAIGDDDITSLHRLISGLRAAGVTPLIVRTPAAPDWVGLHPHGDADVERFDAVIASAAKIDGVAFVDLAPRFPTLEDYADPVHVNGRGQERFTAFLATAIAGSAVPASATEGPR